MTVYIEYAFLENFILDGALILLSVVCAREKVRPLRLLLASLIGAAEAIVFPLIGLPVWAQYILKLLGGLLLPVVAVRAKTFKPYAVAAVVFFLLTFALGGLLTAIYSFFSVSYDEAGGYLIGQAPVGLVLGSALFFAIAVVFFAKHLYRRRKIMRNLVDCTLTAGDRVVHWRGLIDSGNCLEFRGKPVCVVSAAAIFALFGKNLKESGRMVVRSVNGERDRPVFSCEKMQLGLGRRARLKEDVYLTVGRVEGDYQLVLSSALMEA